MIKLYFLLFYEFLKIGIFAVGGGYAAIPFLFFLQHKYFWFSADDLTNMIAISNITPGPIGINMATYVGFKSAGILGSIISTSAIVFAPFFFTIFLVKLFNKFKLCSVVESIFKGLRPASCALLTSIAIKLFYQSIFLSDFNLSLPSDFDFKALFLFLAFRC